MLSHIKFNGNGLDNLLIFSDVGVSNIPGITKELNQSRLLM